MPWFANVPQIPFGAMFYAFLHRYWDLLLEPSLKEFYLGHPTFLFRRSQAGRTTRMLISHGFFGKDRLF
jgi:hypothetical protein